LKIKDVKYELYLQEQPQVLKKERSGFPRIKGKIPFPILRIITDDGVEGFAFGEDREIPESTVSGIRQMIVGKDPFDREWIWQSLWQWYDAGRGETKYYAKITLKDLAYVDIALWDIAGKALGQPIYKLLGAYRDKIKVYASSSNLSSPQAYADEVSSCKKQGVTAYKLHVDPEITVEACRASRRAGGDDMVLMLDGGPYQQRELALRMGKLCDELNFYWYEEPILDSDIEGLIKLREKLDVPIAAAETPLMSMYSIPEYLIRRAVDIVRPDVMIYGGITPVKKVADMCDAFGMQCELHSGAYGFPICNVANLHVECASKNCEFHELRWPDVVRFGLKEYPVLDNEGYVHIPQKPGLGVEIDWESLGKPVMSY